MQPTNHLVSYPRFLWKAVGVSTDGSLLFYAWMTLLTALALVGVNAWAHQTVDGLAVTGMSDHVSWGLYIANFTYLVGLAAGAVMMVIPAYVYRHHDMHDVVILGEILAIASIVMTLLFVNADMGRPDRIWHLMPIIGRFNWPISMLTWDVVVLTGYLLLNLHVVGYLLYSRFLGRTPDRRWYIPFVFLSIVWAVSIHTVTAFLYSGLGGRPFWNTAILAPRFIISAFVTGPAFLVLALQLVRRLTDLRVGEGAIGTLVGILRVTVLANMFLLGSELFTSFYTGGAHAASVRYLFFGLHGRDGLVPWIWTALVFNVASAVVLQITPRRDLLRIDLACVLALVGIWIEKGMGMVIPGFIPSTLHELVEYSPTAVEWKVTVGIWAFGLLLFTLGTKLAISVFSGQMRLEGR